MDRRCHCFAALSLILAVAGCAKSTPEYRTFAEHQDGDAAVESAQPPQIAASPTVLDIAKVGASPLPGQSTAAAPALPDSTPLAVPQPATAEPRPPRAPLPDRIALLNTAPNAPPAPAATGPLEIKLLIPEKEFARVDAGKSLRVSYDDLDLLKVLNMEPVPPDCTRHFPDWLTALDGVQVRIKGFMIPPPRETELPGFTLARDNQICCFGRDPKVYDVIPVFLKDGTTTNYIPNRPFDVVGRFHIRPDVYRGELQNLYEIEDAVVITN